MSSTEFLAIARLVPHPMLLLAGDGLVVAANRAAREILVPVGERLEGRWLAELLADPPAQLADYLTLCRQSGEPILGTVSRPHGARKLRCWGARGRDDGDDVRIVLHLEEHNEEANVDRMRFTSTLDELARETQRRIATETELRVREQELRESEQQLRVILDAIGDAVMATDADGRVSFMNPTAQMLTEWPEEQAKGKPLAEVFQRGGCGALVARSGAETPIDARTVPLPFGEKVHPRGVVIVFRAIAERAPAERERLRRAEQAALSSAQRSRARIAQVQALSAAFATALTPDDVAIVALTQGNAAIGAQRAAIAVLAEQGTVLRVMQEIGYAGDGVDRGLPIPMSEHTPMAEVARSGRAVFLETLDSVPHRYPALFRRFHGQVPGRAIAVLPLTVQGRTFGSLVFSFDEVRRFNAEDQSFLLAFALQCAQALDRARGYETEASARVAAEAANRAKDEFLATLSHELRTPLTAILGWAHMLRTRTMEPVAIARALATIERNAKAQCQLIEDILDVSRIVAGKLRLEVRPVDATSIVREAVEAVRPTAEAKRVRLEVAIGDALGTLVADPTRLQQIVWNLLSNAVKFTPPRGAVEVRLDVHGERARLRVIDSGAGIEEAFLPHVFERFRQADASDTRKHGGLGLGLAIVKHLVEMHSGTITAESAGAGRGATFTVTLPLPSRLDDTGTGVWVADPVTEVPRRLDGLRVLIVDDEPEARELIAAILEGQGARVEQAASAADALRSFVLARPDVLVSDIGMPNQDGYTLLKQVRVLGREHGRQVPALALTAYAAHQDVDRAALAGFQLHLAKPVVPARLIDAVAKLAGQADARSTGAARESSSPPTPAPA